MLAYSVNDFTIWYYAKSSNIYFATSPVFGMYLFHKCKIGLRLIYYFKYFKNNEYFKLGTLILSLN